MKIYFAGSILGGREDAALHLQTIEYRTTFGEVLTEHISVSTGAGYEIGRAVE